jgi:phospholipase C
VVDGYTDRRSNRQQQPRATWSTRSSAVRLFGWYDLTITAAADPGFAYRLAGHVDDGRDSATDPRMGGLIGQHP